MAKTNMTLRIDPQIKEQATILFKELGLDLSTATGLFYRQALRCHGLPFVPKLEEPNETTYKAIESSEKGENLHGPFATVEEFMESLNA